MISILATIYFLAAAIAAHVVSTQYNFFSDYISDYAIGSWGWIYGSAFLASCIGCFALAISLRRRRKISESTGAGADRLWGGGGFPVSAAQSITRA